MPLAAAPLLTCASQSRKQPKPTLETARSRMKLDSGTSYFFICVGDQPELDFGGRRNPDGQGFAAFGRVVQGMDVVRAINQSPAEGQNLIEPVRILSVSRVGS